MRKQHAERGHLIVDSSAMKSLQRRAMAAMQRCQNPKDKGWKHYGGRGIQCEFPSVKAFVEYLLSLHPALDWEGMTIDRINNEGNYVVENLRKASYRENNLNRRNTRKSMTS